MFIGHFAVGLASKRVAPRTNLAFLLAAPLLLDLLWPIFLATGVEHASLHPGAPTPFLVLGLDDYPWSHSLLMALSWSAVAALLVYLVGHRDRRAAAVIAAGVFSHWVLDFITHRPDMPLMPGGAARVGLGLWTSTIGTVVVEGGMFVAAVWLYLSATRARGLAGKLSIGLLVGLLSLAYVGSIFSPPPPSMDAVKIAALFTWLFVPWAYWIERSRALAA